MVLEHDGKRFSPISSCILLLQLICQPCSATVHDHDGDCLHHFFSEGSCYSRCIFLSLSATVRV